jgi:hypothetical protein
MESWADCNSPEFISMTVSYLFSVLPFAAIGKQGLRLCQALLRSIDNHLDAFHIINKVINVNALIACPEKAVREAANSIAFEYLKRTQNKDLCKSIFEFQEDLLRYILHFDEYLGMLLKLVTAIDGVKEAAMDSGFDKQLAAFFEKQWPVEMEKAKAKWSSASLSNLLFLLAAFKLPQSLREYLLGKDVLENLFGRASVPAIAAVLKSFNGQKQVLETVRSYATGEATERFKSLVTEMTRRGK